MPGGQGEEHGRGIESLEGQHGGYVFFIGSNDCMTYSSSFASERIHKWSSFCLFLCPNIEVHGSDSSPVEHISEVCFSDNDSNVLTAAFSLGPPCDQESEFLSWLCRGNFAAEL